MLDGGTIDRDVGSRVHDLKDVEAILDVFQAHGHDEVSEESCMIHAYLNKSRLTLPVPIRVVRAKSTSRKSTGRNGA